MCCNKHNISDYGRVSKMLNVSVIPALTTVDLSRLRIRAREESEANGPAAGLATPGDTWRRLPVRAIREMAC
jgi:hypothetical protein